MELLTMQTNQFKVGDVVQLNAFAAKHIKQFLGKHSPNSFRVLGINASQVQIRNMYHMHADLWLAASLLELVKTVTPEPIFTPTRPTEPSPSLAAAYGKSMQDMTDKEVSQYLADKPRTNAVSIMQSGIDAMTDRAAERDSETERSMSAAVAAFNALHGTNLTEELGWQFMVLLKMSRAKGGKFRLDDYIDGAAYNALAGEAAAKERQ